MKQYRVEKLQSYLSEYQKRQFKSEYSRCLLYTSPSPRD